MNKNFKNKNSKREERAQRASQRTSQRASPRRGKPSLKPKGLQLPGIVTQCLSNGMFRIKLENGFQVLAYISGKIRRNSIRILLGDQVMVEVSAYDLSRGRIVYRFKR